MAKFYAVRNGRHIGIYETWEECRAQVDGYSGAEYKSFGSRSDAINYIGTQISLFDEPSPGGSTAVAYVDGSYNLRTCQFSFGVVIFHDGAEHTFSECFSDPNLASMRNVAGEIKGAQRAMQYCLDNGITSLEIYYDYEGIEKWCTGEWKTNKEGTIAYKRFYDEAAKSVEISFNKVKGHSGNRYNDMADRLAKDALGID